MMKRPRKVKVAVQNWLRLKCKPFNKHEYVVEDTYTEDILKLHCKKCKKSFGANLKSAMIFAWDDDMELSLSILKQNLENDSCSKSQSISKIPLKIVV